MRFWILLMVVILAGCSGDDEILKEPLPVATFVSAHPPGPCRPVNGTITVTFDHPPRDVTVSAGAENSVGTMFRNYRTCLNAKKNQYGMFPTSSAVNPCEIAVFGEHRIGRFSAKRWIRLRIVRCRRSPREFARPPIDGKEV